MTLDQTANFVNVAVSGTHTASDTQISLEAGQASELPDPANGEYNLVWWDAENFNAPDKDSGVEIVRVTGRDTGTDTITVQRGREDTSAVAHDTGDVYRMLLGSTSKMFSDINDVTNLDGSSGAAGQFLQTDGTNLSFASVSGGMTVQERQAFNDLVARLARNDFEDNLSALNYDGGLYEIWADTDNVASQSNVNIQALSGGDPNGIAELATTVVGSWILSNASYSGTSISTQDSRPQGIFWKSDGTKFWEIGDGSDLIYEYNVSTAWDLSTASYSGTSISTQDSFPSGIFWKSDGTKFWEIGSSSDLIFEYNVSTAWDLSTASYSGTSISTQDSVPTGIFWKSDGTKFWEIGLSSDLIFEYNVSTAWDLSTASYSGTSISTQDSRPQGIFWKSDGTKFWEIGNGSDLIFEYSVGSTEFASSGSVTLVSKNLSLQENGGFTNPPQSAVLSQAASIPTNTDIQYIIKDGNGNTATVTQSDVDTEIDVSNFTSAVIEVEVDLSQSTTNNDASPTSDDVMVHFQE